MLLCAGPGSSSIAPPQASSPASFDFSAAMHALMSDVARSCDELHHVDMSRVAVGYAQARHSRPDGTRATIHPLRFPGGRRAARRRGHTFRMPDVVIDGTEILYVITYTLPRFLNGTLDEKMTTIFHEMYHISPRFDGDLRRFPGARQFHTGRANRYDAVVARLASRYLGQTAAPELHAFLRHTFRELAALHGGIVGTRFRGLAPHAID